MEGVLLVVVRFSSQYGLSAVELFHEEEADELVGEGHLREGYLLVGQGVYRRIETVGTSHDEYHAARPCVHSLLQPRRKLHGAPFGAVLIEEHYVVAALQLFPDELCLGGFLLFGGECLGGTELWYHLDGKRHIVAQAAAVVVDECLDM